MTRSRANTAAAQIDWRNNRRPDQRQKDTERARLHDALDRILDAKPKLAHQSQEMGRGYPENTLGGGGGTSELTSVERAAMQPDPAEDATRWLAHVRYVLESVARLADKARWLLPVDPGTVDRARPNTVELCALCGDPAPKVHRVDGQPYHADTCYYRLRRVRAE